MTTLCFVMPVYRRYDLTRVCMAQLVRTCAELGHHGVEATAVVVGDDDNLAVARLLGLHTVRRENNPLGRKFNDGLEYGASPAFLGCEYVVPIGSDNWVHHELVLAQMPAEGTVGAHRLFTMVHESGSRSVLLDITYDGGDGIRTLPSAMLEPLRYRPAEEGRERAVDTSIWNRLGRVRGGRPPFAYTEVHDYQIVGFQSSDQQLNTYASLREVFQAGPERTDHWERLEHYYSAEAVAEVREVYEGRQVAA